MVYSARTLYPQSPRLLVCNTDPAHKKRTTLGVHTRRERLWRIFWLVWMST